ncbi:hypothetical protein ACP70R_000754 [Stipagrostis hirtigluma subsp. patula]
MVAAAPLVTLRRPSALLRGPVRYGLPASRVASLAAPLPRRADSLKISPLQLTATRSSKENSSSEDDELLADIRDKWDALENKSSLLLYSGGAIIAAWLSSVVVRAVGSVPLLPDLLELVGLGYSGWFVYRYLLFQENRKELANIIDDLKKRITGDDE